MSDVIGPAATVARFDPRPESVRDARRFVSKALADTGELADDAALLVSELATNAVIHAGSEYTITIRRQGGVIRVEVADGSAATARRCHYSPTSGTGRGLGMVEDLASGWGVEEAVAAAGADKAEGKVIWFELPLPSSDGAAGGAAAAIDVSGGTDHAATDAELDALLAELGGWDDDEDAGSGAPVASMAGVGA
jgi:anti-sigma regulatory factor (Ser/Thr protein kinase)